MSLKIDFEEARAFLLQVDDWIIERQKELTAIPAPPFGEGPRGKRMAELFQEVGLISVEEDQEGNVMAELPGRPAGTDPLIVSAHLDTVFPPGTDVTPRESGEVIRAPGISDDGRGLAALLALARVLAEVPLPLTNSPPLRGHRWGGGGGRPPEGSDTSSGTVDGAPRPGASSPSMAWGWIASSIGVWDPHACVSGFEGQEAIPGLIGASPTPFMSWAGSWLDWRNSPSLPRLRLPPR